MRQCDCHVEKHKSKAVTMGDALISIGNTLPFNSREYEQLTDQMDIRMKPASAVRKVAGVTSYFMRD